MLFALFPDPKTLFYRIINSHITRYTLISRNRVPLHERVGAWNLGSGPRRNKPRNEGCEPRPNNEYLVHVTFLSQRWNANKPSPSEIGIAKRLDLGVARSSLG